MPPRLQCPENPPAPFDPVNFHLIRTLQEIASDPRSGGVGRVQACKLLAELDKPTDPNRVPVVDRVSARAVSILAELGKKGLH